MSRVTLTIVVLALVTYGLKSFGPIVLGGRTLPPRLARLADELPAPLLGALVIISTFTAGASWEVDARAIGLAVAALALWRRLPFVLVVLAAAGATALARAV